MTKCNFAISPFQEAFATKPIDGKEYGKADQTQGIAGGAKNLCGRGYYGGVTPQGRVAFLHPLPGSLRSHES
jgi:hypothetical protein